MAFPTAVNSQITDAVTQANVKVLADAPSHGHGLDLPNACPCPGHRHGERHGQPASANQVAQAVVTRCVESLLGSADK